MVRRRVLAPPRPAATLAAAAATVALALAFGRGATTRPLLPAAALGLAGVAVLVARRDLRWLVPLTTVGLAAGSSALPVASSAPVLSGKFLLMGAVGAAALPALSGRRDGRVPGGFAAGFLALVALALLSTAHSVAPAETLRHGLSLAVLWLAIAVGVPLALRDPSDLAAALRRVGLVAAGLVGAGALLSAAGAVDGFQAGRFQGLLSNPNTLGYFLAPVLPAVVLMVAHEPSPRRRRVMGAAVAGLAIGLFLSGSRGGLLASAFGTAVGLAAGGRARRVLAVAAVAGAVTAGLVVALDRPVRPVPQNREGLFEVGTGSGRSVGWAVGVRLASARPLTGYGFATTPVLFPEAGTRDLARRTGTAFGRLHNSYLEAAIDLGWPAAALLAGLGLSGAVAAWRVARDPHRRSVGAMILAGIGGGMVEGVFESGLLAAGGLLAFHFWLLVGAAHALRRRAGPGSGAAHACRGAAGPGSGVVG